MVIVGFFFIVVRTIFEYMLQDLECGKIKLFKPWFRYGPVNIYIVKVGEKCVSVPYNSVLVYCFSYLCIFSEV